MIILPSFNDSQDMIETVRELLWHQIMEAAVNKHSKPMQLFLEKGVTRSMVIFPQQEQVSNRHAVALNTDCSLFKQCDGETANKALM